MSVGVWQEFKSWELSDAAAVQGEFIQCIFISVSVAAHAPSCIPQTSCSSTPSCPLLVTRPSLVMSPQLQRAANHAHRRSNGYNLLTLFIRGIDIKLTPPLKRAIVRLINPFRGRSNTHNNDCDHACGYAAPSRVGKNNTSRSVRTKLWKSAA